MTTNIFLVNIFFGKIINIIIITNIIAAITTIVTYY